MYSRIINTEIAFDPCQRSIDLLCDSIFKNYKWEGDLWIPDHQDFYKKIGDKEVCDVVFLGGYLKRFLESGCWPNKKYRFWCLSRSVKHFLVKYLNFPENSVGVLDRYRLFPVLIGHGNESAIDWREGNLIYSGRISAVKNFKSVVAISYHMQSLGWGGRLEIYGEFDNTSSQDFGIDNYNDYKLDALSFIQMLDWKRRPVFHGRLASKGWMSNINKNDTFISLSKYILEDFGVSLAQMQSLGNRVIVSDWGGHCDVNGENVSKIPPSIIPYDFYPRQLLISVCKHIATSVWNDAYAQFEITKNKNTGLIILKNNNLDYARKLFVEQTGIISLLILKNETFSQFARQKKGLSLFSLLRGAMVEYSSDKKERDCLIFHDEKVEASLKLKQMFSLVPFYCLHLKDFLKLLLSADRIYSTGFNDVNKLLDKLNILGVKENYFGEV